MRLKKKETHLLKRIHNSSPYSMDVNRLKNQIRGFEDVGEKGPLKKQISEGKTLIFLVCG